MSALLIVIAIVVIALLSIPNFGGSHRYPRNGYPANACINNLRQMDAAAQQWARETGQNSNAMVTLAVIKPYIKLNSAGQIPSCPAGGTYAATWNITSCPTCTMSTATPPHILPR